MARILLSSKRKTFIILLSFSFINGQTSDINIIRDRIYQSILNTYLGDSSHELDFDNEAVEKILLDFDGEKWPYIHYEDVSKEGFDNTIHLNHLLRMAVAYKSSKSNYFKDKKIFLMPSGISIVFLLEGST